MTVERLSKCSNMCFIAEITSDRWKSVNKLHTATVNVSLVTGDISVFVEMLVLLVFPMAQVIYKGDCTLLGLLVLA